MKAKIDNWIKSPSTTRPWKNNPHDPWFDIFGVYSPEYLDSLKLEFDKDAQYREDQNAAIRGYFDMGMALLHADLAMSLRDPHIFRVPI